MVLIYSAHQATGFTIQDVAGFIPQVRLSLTSLEYVPYTQSVVSQVSQYLYYSFILFLAAGISGSNKNFIKSRRPLQEKSWMNFYMPPRMPCTRENRACPL